MAAPERTDRAIGEVLPEMLDERGLSLRGLASEIEMSVSHLSRALRGEERKHLSASALEEIALVLGVAPAYFAEYRTEVVVQRVQRCVGLANRIFDEQDAGANGGRDGDSDAS